MTISPADVILILFGLFFFIRNITSLQYRVQGLECASKYKPYFIPFTVIWAIMRPRRDPSRTYGVD